MHRLESRSVFPALGPILREGLPGRGHIELRHRSRKRRRQRVRKAQEVSRPSPTKTGMIAGYFHGSTSDAMGPC